MSNRKQARLEAKQFIDTLSVQPYPNSRKAYIEGSRPDIKVPVREIELSDSLVGGTKEAPIFESNDPIHVYDTSGLYTDPTHQIDLYNGLPKLREQWISERSDTEVLDDVSSVYAKERLEDETLDELSTETYHALDVHQKANVLLNCTMQERESLPLKWNILRFVKTWDELSLKTKCLINSTPAKALAPTYQKKLHLSSYEKRSRRVAQLFLRTSITLNLNL